MRQLGVAAACGIVAACSNGGGDGTITIDQSRPSAAPTAVITAPASMDERSEITMSAAGSTSGTGQIATYSWIVYGANNANVQIRDAGTASPTLVVDEIGTTLNAVLELTIVDSAGNTANTTSALTINEIDAALLPPLPDAAASMASVLGIDTDNDGVRDDVEHSIYNLHPLDTDLREELLIGAHAMQMQIAAGFSGDQSLSDAAAVRTAEFAACTVDPATNAMQREIGTLTAMHLNTADRRAAHAAFDTSRAGTIQQTIELSATACSFAF